MLHHDIVLAGTATFPEGQERIYGETFRYYGFQSGACGSKGGQKRVLVGSRKSLYIYIIKISTVHIYYN